MNHQPFRDWLLSEDELSSDQSDLLQEHLKSCDSCSEIESAWLEVESACRKIPQVAPASGFTDRWQLRLAEYQNRKQKYHGWLTFGLTVLIVTSLSVILVTQFWSLLQAPGPYLAAWFSRFVDLISIYFSLQNRINPFYWDIPVYTFVGMFFLVGIASFMSVLWLAAYRKLSFVRRIV
jgi:hypothetical protein